MPKAKGASSKRMGTNQRHKVERKKREHKRDLRKAAKAMKSAGLGAKRSKKSRETAKLALKISNNHPDKEEILTKILQAREAKRVLRSEKKTQKREDELAGLDETTDTTLQAPVTNKKSLLYISNSRSNDFGFQFIKALEEMVYPISNGALGEDEEAASAVKPEMPCCAFLVTIDARCAVQSAPWTLLDAIVDRAEEYAAETAAAAEPAKKRGRKEAAESVKPQKSVLVLFALTKADLVSSQTISAQFALLANALHARYVANKPNKAPKDGSPLVLPGGLIFSFVPVSTQFERCQKHLLRTLRRFLTTTLQPKAASGTAQNNSPTAPHNMSEKVCTFVIGLPNTGRRTLARCLLATGTDSGVSVSHLRAAQVQLIKAKDSDNVTVRFAIPNSKSVTLIQFPEDARLRKEATEAVASGDVLFQSMSYVEKMDEPESIATLLAQNVVDPVTLAQAFCQPLFATGDSEESVQSILRFLKGVGHTVRREGGFHVSPLFVSSAGTAGQIAATALSASTGFASGQQSNQLTLIDSSYSNARPSKLVRISNITVKGKGRNSAVRRVDGTNALRIGARTFIREFCQGKNVPWAILRAKDDVLTPQRVAEASRIFNLSLVAKDATSCATSGEHLTQHMQLLTQLLKDVLVLLPNGVVEFSPDSIVPVLHNLQAPEEEEEEEEDEEDSDEEGDDEEGDEEEEGDDEEGDDEEDDDEEDDEEDDE